MSEYRLSLSFSGSSIQPRKYGRFISESNYGESVYIKISHYDLHTTLYVTQYLVVSRYASEVNQ